MRRIPWNKGKTGVMPTPWNKGKKWNLETRKKMSLARMGKEPWNKGTKGKMVAWNKGLKMPPRDEEVRQRISKSMKGVNTWMRGRNLGKKSHLWKGGLTSKNLLERSSWKYAEWRKLVFTRDGFACILCGDNTSGNLQAYHIKPFAYFPELRLDVNNGRTLCVSCHKKTDTYMNRANKYKSLCKI